MNEALKTRIFTVKTEITEIFGIGCQSDNARQMTVPLQLPSTVGCNQTELP